MSTSAESVLALLRRQGVVRPRDLVERGISRKILERLVERGLVVRVGRGLYSLAEDEPDENRRLAEAARRVPQGVVCLLSALAAHDLTTQQPYEVWMAIASSARQPVGEHPPLRIVRMSGDALSTGLETVVVDGTDVRVFGVAKTVADCFKFRSKVGLDVALEALRQVLEERRASIDELLAMAAVCRVTRVMQPYVEALA
ncbi:MAG: AbiEi antitoxin N-terminal domain-containing protein [Planctomycetes bacterium]|nr:AbiEi antitoxin N-terminal domain-containing protein [Planctomycetota bacterium]